MTFDQLIRLLEEIPASERDQLAMITVIGLNYELRDLVLSEPSQHWVLTCKE